MKHKNLWLEFHTYHNYIFSSFQSILHSLRRKTVTETMNSTNSESFDEQASWIAFCFSAVICAITGIVSIFGNGMVIYVASSKDDLSNFVHLNWVVKNLAICDLFYGIIAVPLSIVFLWWGKKVF